MQKRSTLSGQSGIAALLAFVLACVGGGFALAGLAMPLVAASGSVSNATTSMFDELPTHVTFTEPSEQSVILAADGTELARFYAENRINVSSDQISQHLKDAVVSIEDERFFQHRGLDVQGTLGAAFNNVTGGNLAGGSTITQQYVKNLLIEEGRFSNNEEQIKEATEKSLARKLSEARMALAIEKQMTKDQILTGYLNLAMFGPSQYGAEAASQYFFSKPAKDLDIPQSAMLAGITQNPGKWNPVRNPENAKIRRDTVLAKMYELGYITEDEFKVSTELPIEKMLKVSQPVNGCESAGISVYFCDYVVKDVLQSEEWGASAADRLNLLYRGGLIIHTTLDRDKQQKAYESVVGQIPVNDPSGIEMAMSSVEPGTGHIVSMVQNTNYGTASDADPNATKINLNVGRAYGGGNGFQSGSTFKLFGMIEWIRSGRSLYERLDADKRDYPRDTWNISCAPELAADYNTARNIEGIGSGMMTVLDSLKKSVNLSFVNLANQLDMCNIMNVASSLGVETGAGTPLEPRPSAILGTNTVTPLSMANAMASLSNEGVYCRPMSFTKIENVRGEVLGEFGSNCHRVLDKKVADESVWALQQVVSPDGTGRNAQLANSEAAGKTGTANNDWHAWFVGLTPSLGTATWVGHMDENISMFYTTINGVYNVEVYGGSYPARAFANFNNAILEGQPHQVFDIAPVQDQGQTETNILPKGRGNPTFTRQVAPPRQVTRPAPQPIPSPEPEPAPQPAEEQPAPAPDPGPPADGNNGNNGNNGDSPENNNGNG